MRINIPMYLRSLIALCILFSGSLVAAPKVEAWTTSLGSKVMFVRADSLPMVDIRVVFDAGSARDEKLPGLASFVNNMLTEGSAGKTADEMAVLLEDEGIQLGTGSLRDMAWVTIRTLTEPAALDVAIEAMADTLAKPNFDEKSVERVRQQMQVVVRRSMQSASSVAKRRLYEALYAGHPYATPPEGSDESLKEISVKDLRAFHRQYYVASNATIAVVGDLTREQAETVIEKVMAKLQRGQHAKKVPDPEIRKGGHLHETFPSTQTHIFVGQVGMARHDPDYFPLYVGNHVLGGSGLVSVLGEEVRNKRGLSYSVYSYFSPMRASGPFLMAAQTKNQQSDEALDVMRETLADYLQKGPTVEQLEAAKQNIIGGFPLRISSNKKIVEYLAMMAFYDLPTDWLDTLVEKIEKVNVSQIWSAWQRRVKPENQVVVVVGGK